ncbi:helix-turn-helix domain-containing protein [Rhodoferax antarcticus]|uniref:helix-turn-helix domain-containing protein n=1 Tax=Rhodoferax antarcticus TaxID=81479 RepID=UPI002225B251|nr:helix-turn-helix domain-containing protein [Rhodoferax antarcticus]MCW2314318.1 transcriptional regulator with XRE-family HTH domain [Rhodoferax antarcticus]MCW2314340.1 transcriptional regulator with XRE-family HTH domain [Rhodoferax antarcticus]
MSQEIRIVSSLRAARAALGWSQPVFAKQAGVSLVALARMEAGMASPRLSTVAKLKSAIESAGIRIADDYPPGGYTVTVTEAAIAQALRRPVVGEESPALENKAV